VQKWKRGVTISEKIWQKEEKWGEEEHQGCSPKGCPEGPRIYTNTIQLSESKSLRRRKPGCRTEKAMTEEKKRNGGRSCEAKVRNLLEKKNEKKPA